MELFPATDVKQLDYIKRVIDECDYYILIMGGRYGSIDAEGVSYTEREYDYAVETGKVVLAFVHDDPDLIPVGKSDVMPEVVTALNAFRDKVMTGRLVRNWTNRQNLEPIVLKSLIHAFYDMPRTGWVRGDAIASDILIGESNKLLQENADLRAKIADLLAKRPPQISDIAGLEDDFVIRYESRHQKQYGQSYFLDRTIKVTWKQIFLAIAGHLDTPKTDHVILEGLKDAVKEADGDFAPYRLNNTDTVRIKVQLTALGLISAENFPMTRGNIADVLSLTDKGRSLFIEGMVVRKRS